MGNFGDYDYGSVAGFYDELAEFYSRGRIGATKRVALEVLRPGDRVLFAGVGRGEEAIQAIRFGARVTAIDVSPTMLRRFREKLDREGLDAELIESDVSTYRASEPYDVVVANYFLNLFDAARAREMLEILGRSIRPRGCLVVSDFALPGGGAFGRFLTECYYSPVNWIAWMLGLCALHPILDYASLLDPSVFRILEERRLPVLFGRDPAYMALIAERHDGAS